MVLFLVPLSCISLFIAYKLYTKSELVLPPGPSPWLIIGNFHTIEPMKHWCYAKWSKVYGPIISVWTGSTLYVIVSKSKLAKQVFKNNALRLNDKYVKSTNIIARLLWDEYDPNYIKLRKVCTHEFFSHTSLEALRPIRENEVMTMVKTIYIDNLKSNGKSLTLRKYLGSMGFNVITRMVLGKRFVTKEGEMDEQGAELLSIIVDKLKIGLPFELEGHIPWLTWMISPKRAAHYELEARRDQQIKTIIEDIRVANESGGGDEQHFVNVLTSLSDKYAISERYKIRLLWEVITSGIDTTAVTLEWAMAQLIRNQRIQQKVQEELDLVIGSNRFLNETDLPNLPYLKCLAKEALRIHPPTSLMLPHKANARTKIGGYDIPKGTNVNVNAWAIARDVAVWPEPLEFRPERFNEEDIDLMGNDFRLLPFGKGTHACPAAQLGMNMIMSTLGHLLHHFSWKAAEGFESEEIDMTESPGSVTFMATPLQAVPTLRLPANMYQHLDTIVS